MTETTTELARRVADLLMHASGHHPIAPDLVTFKGPHGGHGIAVVVDGYYSTPEGAAGMVEFWRGLLRRAVDEVAKVDVLDVEAAGR